MENPTRVTHRVRALASTARRARGSWRSPSRRPRTWSAARTRPGRAQAVHERRHETGARRAERMPQRDGPALRVEPLGSAPGLSQPGQRHARERLVDLVAADVGQRQARPGQDLGGRGDRAGQHDHGVVTDDGDAVHVRQRRHPALRGPLRGRHQQRRCPVGDLRRVSGGHRPVRSKCGPQCCEASTEPLAGSPRRRSPRAVGSGHRDQLLLDAAAVRRVGRPLVRADRVLVQLRAGQPPSRRDVLGPETRWTSRAPCASRPPHSGRGPPRRTSPRSSRPPSAPGSSTRRRRRRPRHSARRPAPPRRSAPPAATTRTAVRRSSRYALRPAGRQRRTAPDVHRLLSGLGHAAPDHVLHGFGSSPGSFGEGPQDRRPEVDRVHVGEAASAPADRRTQRGHDHRVAHHTDLDVKPVLLLQALVEIVSMQARWAG